jgi:hypothetical protein
MTIHLQKARTRRGSSPGRTGSLNVTSNCQVKDSIDVVFEAPAGCQPTALLDEIAARFADAAIELALAAFPDLGSGGFGGGPYAGEFDRAQIATALLFLSQCRKVAPKRAPCGSYGLKHMIERWGRNHGFAPYVGNGVAIAAACALGFPIEKDGWGPPNAAIGVAAKDLKRLTAPHGWTWPS